MSKLQRVDKWCPNLIINNQHYAIGEIKTWGEFNTSPINEVWSIKENDFKESLEKNYHYFVVIRKDDHTSNHIFLIQTNSLGEIYEIRNLNNIPSSTIFYKKEIEPFKTIIATHVNGTMMFEFNKEREDISKKAYDISSELFSFKDFRRGIIEHGKVCYIEGYKKHANLFYNFLIDNGYFSREELNTALAEFDNFMEGTPIITIESAEDTFTKLRPRLPQDSCLTQVQKDVIDLYRKLNGDRHTLVIQKPRQRGISTICEIITYVEAQNGKKILYAGYGPCDTALKDLRNLTYVQLRSNETEIPIKYLINKRYDLIIVDEISSFRLPYETEKKLDGTLSENGRMIIIGTPLEPEWQNYKAVKDYFTSYNTSAVSEKNRITYTIHPEEADYERAKKYPECENEMLGLWKN